MADQWYAVYNTETGALVSSGTSVADPLPDGLSATEIPAEPHAGMTWDVLMLTFVPNPTLTTDVTDIPADGTTAATVTYTFHGSTPPATVDFTINGAVQTVDVVDGVATLPVASTTAGDTITIVVGGSSVTVQVGA